MRLKAQQLLLEKVKKHFEKGEGTKMFKIESKLCSLVVKNDFEWWLFYLCLVFFVFFFQRFCLCTIRVFAN